MYFQYFSTQYINRLCTHTYISHHALHIRLMLYCNTSTTLLPHHIPPSITLKNSPYMYFPKSPLCHTQETPPIHILKKILYMYFPKPPYCIFHIVRKCTEMLWNNASDGKSSRISTGNALRCTEMVDLTGNALKCRTNAREDTR